MAKDQSSPRWWQTAPGLLTAGAAFVAAVSGLIGGLNQIGAFDRLKDDTPMPPPAASAPVQKVETGRLSAKDTAAPEITTPVAAAPKSSVTRRSSGTVIELASGARVCSTMSQPGDRFNATVVVPVAGSNNLQLPVGSAAVPAVTRLEAPTFIGVRVDSIVYGGRSFPVAGANARPQREFVAGASQSGVGVGACIPAGGRITVTLTAPVSIGRS
ncbi:MAG: hypothetical protein M3477_00525 [Gemmatimonadota bacterium]|nr:hypothetical protein [Gemmatimonadota bacterium]